MLRSGYYQKIIARNLLIGIVDSKIQYLKLSYRKQSY